MTVRAGLATLVIVLGLAASPGSASILLIPDAVVSSTDNFTGPSFTVSGNYTATDIVNVAGIGTIDLSYGNYTANAAGVVVGPATTNVGTHPGLTFINANNGIPYAAILIGNSALGYHALFTADASSGLGAAPGSVPTTVYSLGRTLGSIFGSGVVIADGTVLSLLVNDAGNFADNSGSLVVRTVQPARVEPSPVAAPEPSTLALGALGALGGLALKRLRRKA